MISGMHCTSCELLIKDSLNDLGVKAEANYKKGQVIIDFDPKKIDLKKIHEAIEESGYNVVK